jgi:hypothetical protein
MPCTATHRERGPRGGAGPRLKALAAIGAVACVLAAAGVVAPASGYGIGDRAVDGFGRVSSLRFLHIPKTGTSFIIVLRNYLTACRVKDMTCAGKRGGTNPDYLFPDGVCAWEGEEGFGAP